MTNYIGRDLDKISNIEILDNITFDGSQSYTLQKGGVNFTPNSAQSIILGIDGITQIGNFSVNGSTIDFGVAVANTSTCNYIIHLGTGLLTAPSDGSVTNAKLGTAPTLEAKGSGGTAGGVRYFCEQSSHHVTLRAGQHSGFSSGSFELKLPTAQGGANTFLKNDGSGNLSFASAGGITMADQFRLSANQSAGTNGDITSNLERVDTDGFGQLGTGLTESSGIFSFPPTGIYLIDVPAHFSVDSQDTACNLSILTTTDNSNYGDACIITGGNYTSQVQQSVSNRFIFDVTNTSTHKFKLNTHSVSSGSFLNGETYRNRTSITVIRLGDT